jgi:multidrug efflux system membrane fusion protein
MTRAALIPLFLLLAGGAAVAADAPRPAVPVTVGKAVKRDLQTYLEGLGTVQAYNTVTIRPQVDGQLVKLAVKEGQNVHVGDLLFQIDPRPYQAVYDEAMAKKAQDQAQLANAKLDLERYTKLADKNYIAHQQLDATRAQVNQLEAAVKGDQAAIDAARVNLDYCSIRSPIEGRVGIRAVDVGNVVHASDANGLVVITQLQPIHLIFSLAEDNLQNILKAERAAPPVVAAITREGGKHIDDGVLDVVDNQVDQTTGMVRLRATLPNKSNLLWPGQFVNARMTLDKLAGVLTIPVEAIQRGTEGRSVFVVKGDGTVEQRSIQIGQVSEGVAVVTKGVNDGETVVTSGQYRLETGSKVEIRSAPVTNG